MAKPKAEDPLHGEGSCRFRAPVKHVIRNETVIREQNRNVRPGHRPGPCAGSTAPSVRSPHGSSGSAVHPRSRAEVDPSPAAWHGNRELCRMVQVGHLGYSHGVHVPCSEDPIRLRRRHQYDNGIEVALGTTGSATVRGLAAIGLVVWDTVSCRAGCISCDCSDRGSSKLHRQRNGQKERQSA